MATPRLDAVEGAANATSIQITTEAAGALRELSDPSQVSPLRLPIIETEPLVVSPVNRTDKGKVDALIEFRKQYKAFALDKSKKYKQTLDTIYLRNKLDFNRKNDNLIKLLGNKYFLLNCFEKGKGNTGSLTPGTDSETVDEASEIRFEQVALEIKNGTFKFGRSRRIYVEKPGKKKLRPITIPNAIDKVVQEGIRVILNSIYEPIFAFENWNYGFRPGLSCQDAITAIDENAKGSDFALEGDIDGAYDNVQHDTMIEILSEKISDKKFLLLIKQLHKSGIMEKNITKDTTLGIPQGGIASPILFNIYMAGKKTSFF